MKHYITFHFITVYQKIGTLQTSRKRKNYSFLQSNLLEQKTSNSKLDTARRQINNTFGFNIKHVNSSTSKPWKLLSIAILISRHFHLIPMIAIWPFDLLIYQFFSCICLYRRSMLMAKIARLDLSWWINVICLLTFSSKAKSLLKLLRLDSPTQMRA